MEFNQLFRKISPEEIPDNVFTLFGKVLPIVTVKTADHCNANGSQRRRYGGSL